MKYPVELNKSIGEIHIGMNKVDVNKALGDKYYHKEHVQYPGLSSDWYYGRRFNIGYWENYSVAQIEITKPLSAYIYDIEIFKYSIDEMMRKLKIMNIMYYENNGMLYIEGNNTFLSTNEDNSQQIDSIIIVDDGYLEFKNQKWKEYKNHLDEIRKFSDNS